MALTLQSGVLPKNSFSFYLSTNFSESSALVLGGVNSNYYTGEWWKPALPWYLFVCRLAAPFQLSRALSCTITGIQLLVAGSSHVINPLLPISSRPCSCATLFRVQATSRRCPSTRCRCERIMIIHPVQLHLPQCITLVPLACIHLTDSILLTYAWVHPYSRAVLHGNFAPIHLTD